MQRVPLLVVGGGIGGLGAALAAANAGRRVHVIEKSEEFEEIGAGLQLAPNGTRSLDRLGLLDDVLARATYPRKLVMMDAINGQPLTSLDLGPAFRAHYGYPYVLVHRRDLLAAELRACRAHPLVTLQSGCEVTEFELADDEVRVTCTDGTRFAGHAAVAADGLWSRAREVICGDGGPVCAQYVAYRGTVPIDQAAGLADISNMTLWVGPEMHFVQYVVAGGSLLNQVAVFRSHRYRPGCEHRDDWGTPEELRQAFAPLCARVRDAVRYIDLERRWPMFDRLPADNWICGRMTLLGDAAHPMLQYIAQGACQALEDAVCLGDALRDHEDLEHAFLAYQRVRIPRTAWVQRAARFFGELKHCDGLTRTLRNALLAKRGPNDFEDFDALYA